MFEGVADQRWMDSANCARLPDPSVMFPTGNVDPVALRACATCPVRAACRAYADEHEGIKTRNTISGFIAGETVQQRIARRKRNRAEAERVLADV